MSILAGAAATFSGALLVACFYFFDPVSKDLISKHPKQLLIVAIVVFAIGFAATLESTLLTGFWGSSDHD